MTTVMPQSELTKKAAAWICERMQAKPGSRPATFIAEAGQRFNLSPRDEEMLLNFFKENPNPRPDAC